MSSFKNEMLIHRPSSPQRTERLKQNCKEQCRISALLQAHRTTKRKPCSTPKLCSGERNFVKSTPKQREPHFLEQVSLRKPPNQLSRCISYQYRLSIITLLLFIHHLGLCSSLRILNLHVPNAVRNGSAIYLFCDFELASNEEVYSVKWYKDNIEFFRYLPSNEPYSGKFYRLKGIHVDLHGSNATHVLLYRMELASEGQYSCEVSTDQFITAIAYKPMKVIALPQEKLLRIEGSEFEYDVGHLINLTCICPPTKPQAQLAWYINGKRAPSNLLVKHQSTPVDSSTQVEGSKLGLLFQTRRSDFVNGQLWLKCVASLILSYRYETSQSLDNLRTGSEHRTVNGRKLFSSTSSSDLHLRPKETPVIRGLRTSYRVGDLLNVNCSTTARDAQLKWYLNDEQINSNYLIPYSSLHQTNQNVSTNQVPSASYESLPHQLSNVYYNNGLVAHALKRRTFSIQNTFTTPGADNQQRLIGERRRSLASNNNPNVQPAYAHLNHHHQLGSNNLTNLNGFGNQLDENQVLGLQMPLLQQHFQVDFKLKCVAISHKQVAQLEQSLKIITENHDLARMSQSSVAHSIVRDQYSTFFLIISLLHFLALRFR